MRKERGTQVGARRRIPSPSSMARRIGLAVTTGWGLGDAFFLGAGFFFTVTLRVFMLGCSLSGCYATADYRGLRFRPPLRKCIRFQPEYWPEELPCRRR